MGFTFLKDYSGPYVEMDWRVQEWEARRLLQRGSDKKQLWLGLVWMEKNVLIEKHPRSNNKID